MENLIGEGLCRHIGVSNFSIEKLDTLLRTAKIKPEMNQIELHPYLPQSAMVDFCQSNSIHLTGYAPLGSSGRPARLKVENEPILLDDPVILEIARPKAVTPAQVLLCWAVHRAPAYYLNRLKNGGCRKI